jgi:hypothetical protein
LIPKCSYRSAQLGRHGLGPAVGNNSLITSSHAKAVAAKPGQAVDKWKLDITRACDSDILCFCPVHNLLPANSSSSRAVNAARSGMSSFEFSASDLESLAKLLTPVEPEVLLFDRPVAALPCCYWVDPCTACCCADVSAVLQIKHDAVSTSEISRPSPANIGPKDLLPVTVAPPRGVYGKACTAGLCPATYISCMQFIPSHSRMQLCLIDRSAGQE